MFMPLVSDTTSTPSARAPLEMRAMAASPLMRLLWEMRSSSTAASTTTGMVTASGAQLKAVATASAPKPTCESPSPIMEKRLSTSEVPSSAAQSETSSPTSMARARKG